MTVSFIRWGLTHSRDVTEDATTRSRTAHHVQVVTFATDTQPNVLAGLVAPLDLYDVHLERVEVMTTTNPVVASQDYVEGRNQSVTHFIDVDDSNASQAHAQDLTATAPLVDTTYGGIAAMEIELPRPYVRISGDALAAWGASAPSSALVATFYTDRFPDIERSRAEFGGFIDDGVDPTGCPITSAALLQQLLTKGTPYVHSSQGRTISVPQAIHAGPSPTGEIWVRSSGLGSDPDQIPPSAANNTAERYNFHPAVFLRRIPPYVSSLVQVSRRTPITATRGPLAVWRVDRIPTHSRWLIAIDGAPRVVVVAHPPTTTDLRTPLELWRLTWAAWAAQGGPGGLPLYTVTPSGGSNVFTVTGQLTRASLSQLDYARFIECFDANRATPIVTLITQTT